MTNDITLTIGVRYDVDALVCTGWTAEVDDGYLCWHYFSDGIYSGPDSDGVEPLFSADSVHEEADPSEWAEKYIEGVKETCATYDGVTAHGGHLIMHAEETAARLGDDCCTEAAFLRAFEDDRTNCAACTGKYTDPDEEPDEDPETPDEEPETPDEDPETPDDCDDPEHPGNGRPSRGGRGKRKQIYELTTGEHRQWYSDDARISDAVRADIRERADASGWSEIWDAVGCVVWSRQ